MRIYRTCGPVLALLLIVSWTERVEATAYDFTLIADTSGAIGGFNSNMFPSINAEGTVAFEAFLRTGVEGIFTGNGQTLAPIATNLPPSPISQFGPGQFSGPSINAARVERASGSLILTGSGGSFTTIAHVSSLLGGTSINDRGTVAFATNPIMPGAGLFTGNGGPLTTIIALSGSDVSQVVDHSINGNGSVAFEAFLLAGGMAILTGSGGPLTTIADSRGPFSFLSGPSINGEGTVAFLARLDAGGAGIFIGPDVEADRIIGTGDRLFGSPVNFVEFGGGQSLNDAGQIAFRAGLADGRVVLVRADPIPEPSSLFLLAFGALALLTGTRVGRSL